ncbi:hypothetical protein GCM10009106_18530 [Sphingomonas japonica]
MGAAPNLTLPIPAADGTIATPNTRLSQPATLWHLRAALNVAALQCGKAGDPVETSYNAFLQAHKAALTAAHASVAKEYKAAHGKDAQDAFDDAMTRLYNFYAQPPVRTGFCDAALPLVAKAQSTTDLAGFAPRALASLDAPFIGFYRAYAQYRTDLAEWQAGKRTMLASAAATPRLEVDRSVLMAGTDVTMRGVVRTAAR